MDCPNSHPLHANQPLGQEGNFLSFVSPMNQGLGNHIDGQQQINQSPFWTSLEQHRLQVDQVLQAHNDQVRLALQQQITLQNETILNLVESIASDALMQRNTEIALLRMELQNTQEVLRTTLQDRDEWRYLAVEMYGANQMQEANQHGSSNELVSTGSCNQASNTEGAAVERAHLSLVCKLCCSLDACMLILPCQHLCTCKSCGINLTACPICNSAKVDVIEARFG